MVSEKSTRLYSSFHWPLAASVFLRFQSSRPQQKASVQLLLALTVTQECPSLPPWMLTVCTCVRDYVISGAAVELYTQPLTPPRCQFKAVQSVSGGPDDAMM